MSYQLNISDIGLRLIKAYEGYAPNGKMMRGGRRLVGYGRVTADQSLQLSQAEANTLLMTDLADIENIVNANVHAAMTQSQFDALCSLAYSIGSEAFLNSDVLHAMNRGEVIKAANGFDGWRLGNVDGHVYVVDALVRRRTAEKALFLRSSRTVPAPHEALKATRDTRQIEENIARSHQDNPTRQEGSSSNIVPLYDRADPISPFSDLTEADPNEDLNEAEIFDLTERVDTPSPIAEAAAEVSDRLDALMDQEAKSGEDWPDSFVDAEEEIYEPAHFVENTEPEPAFEHHGHVDKDIVIGDHDVYGPDSQYDSADKFIERAPLPDSKQNFWAFVTMIILGLTMAGAGLWARMTGNLYFGDLSRLAWSATFAIGFLLLVMGAYYLAKQLLGKT